MFSYSNTEIEIKCVVSLTKSLHSFLLVVCSQYSIFLTCAQACDLICHLTSLTLLKMSAFFNFGSSTGTKRNPFGGSHFSVG